MRYTFLLILISIQLVFSGCAVNPVTGKNELAIVSESQEISIGENNYTPSKQLQGGDYSLDPVLSKYVDSVGQRLVNVSDRKLPYEFEVLNNSVPNAWALPGGKIAVNRGLLIELKNEAELAAVLAHEIVHAAARHGAKGMERGILLQGALLAAGIASQGKSYADYLVSGAQVAASLVSTKYGRDAERESDYYGMLYMARAGYDPWAAVGLQETFVRLSKGKESNWLSGLFASHPPSAERVAANRETAKKLPKGGKLGTEIYQSKIAHLIKTKKAYDEFDKGIEAFKKKQSEAAIGFAKSAINIEPREGHFYALLGDIDFSKQQYTKALNNYDQAVKQPGDYFYFFLQRGLVQDKLGKRQDAANDLQASVKLLPTSTAFNALGNIELASGNQGRAKEYFRNAAASNTAPGKEALDSLVRLDLSDNPSKYIGLRTGVAGDGFLIVEISNRTPLPIGGITLQIRYPDNRGVMRSINRRVSDKLPSGKKVIVKTDIGPFADNNVLQSIRVVVVNAAVAQ